jgi:hypothetical protein
VTSTGSHRHSALTRSSSAAAKVLSLPPRECPARYTEPGSAICRSSGCVAVQLMSSRSRATWVTSSHGLDSTSRVSYLTTVYLQHGNTWCGTVAYKQTTTGQSLVTSPSCKPHHCQCCVPSIAALSHPWVHMFPLRKVRVSAWVAGQGKGEAGTKVSAGAASSAAAHPQLARCAAVSL